MEILSQTVLRFIKNKSVLWTLFLVLGFCEQSSHSVVLAVEVVQSQAVPGGAILIRLILSLEPDPPSRCDHLGAHLALNRRPQSCVGKLSMLDRPFTDFDFFHAEPPRQVRSRSHQCFDNCFRFVYAHRLSGLSANNDETFELVPPHSTLNQITKTVL